MNYECLPAFIFKLIYSPKNHFMQKLILFAVFFCFASTMYQLRAQSINNKSWKTYFDAPIRDTAIFNVDADSRFITNLKGEVMVRHQCKIIGDTLTIVDF